MKKSLTRTHCSKRHPRLTHTPGSRVETKEEDSLGSGEIFVQILEVWVLTVLQRVQNIFHFRVSKVNLSKIIGQIVLY